MDEMENNQENPEQKTSGQEAEPEDSSSGPVVGSVIIIIIIIVGGLYFWGKVINQPKNDQTPEEILGAEDETLAELQNQSNSDEIVDIEGDLEATALDGLDSELDNIETELGDL